MTYSVKLFLSVLWLSLIPAVSSWAQEKGSEVQAAPAEMKPASTDVKKEEAVKEVGKTEASKSTSDSAAKADLKKQDDAKAKLAKEAEYIKGFVTQYTAGDVQRKVLAVNQIYKAYGDKMISEKTLIPFLLGAVANPIPRVSLVAHNQIQAATGEKFENDPKLWQKWWDEKLKKEEEAKQTEAGKSGKADEKGKTDTAGTDEPVDELEEMKKKALEQGKKKLLQEHNDTLGYLDRLILTNGGEIECYILFIQKTDDGKIEKYIVQFKDAVGKAEFGVSEVEEVQFDIDKEKEDFLPLPILKENTNP